MPNDRVVYGAGFQLVIKSGTVSKLIKAEVLEGLETVAENYKKEVLKNLSLDDHSLEELRQMGHPYAAEKPENIPHDDRMLHEQSGDLKRSIKLSLPEETTSRRFSVFITSKDPILPYIIYGTSRMRPRRFHEKAFQDIKDKFWEPVIKKLKAINYRTKTFSK